MISLVHDVISTNQQHLEYVPPAPTDTELPNCFLCLFLLFLLSPWPVYVSCLLPTDHDCAMILVMSLYSRDLCSVTFTTDAVPMPVMCFHLVPQSNNQEPLGALPLHPD